MKKRAVSFCVAGIAAITALVPASPLRAEGTSAILAKYRGSWACTFEAPVSPAGPVRGIELFRLDRAGRVLDFEETVASTEPFVALQNTLSGTVFPQPNGTLKGTLVLHTIDPPGLPDQEIEIQCIGMDLQGDRYREMRCLDFFPQADGTTVVGLISCKPR